MGRLRGRGNDEDIVAGSDGQDRQDVGSWQCACRGHRAPHSAYHVVIEKISPFSLFMSCLSLILILVFKSWHR